jgi:hypothetical protein
MILEIAQILRLGVLQDAAASSLASVGMRREHDRGGEIEGFHAGHVEFEISIRSATVAASGPRSSALANQRSPPTARRPFPAGR